MLGNRISRLRNIHNIAQTALAKGIVSQSYMSNIEADRYSPSEEILVCFAKRLGVPQEYLIDTKSIDLNLEELISKLIDSITKKDLDSATVYIRRINFNYEYIASLEQELTFNLVNVLLLFRTKNLNSAFLAFEELVEPISLEDINNQPKRNIELYYYLRALYSYYKKQYLDSYQWYQNLTKLPLGILDLGDIFYNITMCLVKIKDYLNAEVFGQKAYDIYLEHNRFIDLCHLNNLLGVLYLENELLDISERCLLEALEIAEANSINDYLHLIFHNLGLLYVSKGDPKSGLKYFQRCIDVGKDIAPINLVCSTYFSILKIYLNLFDTYNFESTLKELKNVEYGLDEKYQIIALEGKYALLINDSTSYENNMKKAIRFFVRRNNNSIAIELSKEIATYYYAKKKYKSAYNYLSIAYQQHTLLQSTFINRRNLK